MRYLKIVLVTQLFTLFSLFCFAQKEKELDQKSLERLENYFLKGMEEWRIPGIAVSIIHNDTILMARGFGKRHIGREELVDENTMFGIASISKTFTAAALATLVDAGKITWDDKVKKHIPYFEMYDPYVTREMTIRDLLTHRSGLETFSGDLLWNATTYSREDIIKRIKYLQPTSGFRTTYGYSNLMFLTAGEIIPSVLGKSYDKYLAEKFFIPLGMTRTNTSISSHTTEKNLAYPHVISDKTIVPIDYISWDNIAPAGAVNSTVMDLTQWMKLQLHKGILNEKEYFSFSSSREMWKQQQVIDLGPLDDLLFPTTHFQGYGLGWHMFDYLGRKIISHSGALDGMTSQLVLIPEENLGFVILTNSANYFTHAAMYKVMDEYFHFQGMDYSSIIAGLVNQRDAKTTKELESEEANRKKNTKPTLKLEDYVGTYGGELYGDARVYLEEEILFIQFLPAKSFLSKLTHWEKDTFSICFENYPSLPKGKLEFTIGKDGKVEELKIDVPNPDFDFTELKFMKRE